MRTNIEIDDVYVQAIMDRYGVHTKTAAVELALTHLAGQPMTREQALAMRWARDEPGSGPRLPNSAAGSQNRHVSAPQAIDNQAPQRASTDFNPAESRSAENRR